MKLVLFLVFVFNTLLSFAQSSNAINIWNKHLNPVYGFHLPSNVHATVENKYFIKEFNNKTFCADFKTKKGRISTTLSQQGNKYYSRNISSIGFAKELSPAFQLGLSINYGYFQQMEFNQNPKIVFPTFGLKYSLSELNQVYSSITKKWQGKTMRGLPNSILLLWNHKVSNNSTLTLGTNSMINKMEINGSYNYSWKKLMILSLEINSSSNPVKTSFHLNLNSLSIYYESSYHQQLGLSSKIGIGYLW